MSTLVILNLFLCLLILIVAKLVSSKNFPSMAKNSPFECGFDPSTKSSNNFSLQFFMITLIFLIFDVEVVILFPFIFSTGSPDLSNLGVFWVFIILLILGYTWEWLQSMLDWSM